MTKKRNPHLFSAHEQNNQACPQCHDTLKGELHFKHGKHGAFLGCNQYPQCDYIRPLHHHDGHIVKTLDVMCPSCGENEAGQLVLRSGRYGMFIGCHRYPECDYITSPDANAETDETIPQCRCPECKTGHLIERQSRFGKSFYACDAYPKCKFSLNFPPQEGQCEQCGYPLLIRKTIKNHMHHVCACRQCQHVQPSSD